MNDDDAVLDLMKEVEARVELRERGEERFSMALEQVQERSKGKKSRRKGRSRCSVIVIGIIIRIL